MTKNTLRMITKVLCSIKKNSSASIEECLGEGGAVVREGKQERTSQNFLLSLNYGCRKVGEQAGATSKTIRVSHCSGNFDKMLLPGVFVLG